MAVLDEGKFWIEVFTEFMEWDEVSQQRWADAQLQKLHTETAGRKTDNSNKNVSAAAAIGTVDASKLTLQQATKLRTLKKDK